MLEVPSTPWGDAPSPASAVAEHAPAAIDWVPLPGRAEHVFTHFALVITAVHGRIGAAAAARPDGLWQQPAEAALPTVLKKMLGLLPDRAPKSKKNTTPGQHGRASWRERM